MPIEKTHLPLIITIEVEADLIRRVLAAFFRAGDMCLPKRRPTQ